MITNELENDIIKRNRLTKWEENKFKKMNNNFIKELKEYRGGKISMKDLATVDRIEGNYAVCELLDGKMVDIPVRKFKEKVSEGDIFDLEVNSDKGQLTYNIGNKNVKEMEIRRKQILEKLNKIKNK